MVEYPFIFSNERYYRFRRHLVFWTAWWLFQSVLYAFVALPLQISYVDRLPLSAMDSFCYLAPHIFLTYSIMYWVIPKFVIKGRYWRTAGMVLILLLLTAAMAALIGMHILPVFRKLIMGADYVEPRHVNEGNFYLALLAGLRGGITLGGFAASIKLMKYWYIKNQQSLKLEKEATQAQLQLLNAQLHPHFLFNTLNNIYSHTLPNSPVASKLVIGLSDMLRYMLYECKEGKVLLSKELKLIRDYLTLEQIRYNSSLDLNLNLPEEDNHLEIAPLILLPFIENAFKHGTSQTLENPWISLAIRVEGKTLKMKLVNGKGFEERQKRAGGIGISNVKARLDLLYPATHRLKITDTEDAFIVNLSLDLQTSKLERPKEVLHERV